MGKKSKVKTSGMEKYFLKYIKKGILGIDQAGRIWKIKQRRYDPEFGVIKIKKLPRPKRAETKWNQGYLMIQISEKDKKKYCLAHRLVWQYFFGDIPEGFEVNHKDGNRENCSPENLELTTHRANVIHSKRKLKKLREEGKLEAWVKPQDARRAERESAVNIEVNKDRPEDHCPDCKSSGYIGHKACEKCNGSGLYIRFTPEEAQRLNEIISEEDDGEEDTD